MNDPHVESVTYRVVSRDDCAFDAPPLDFVTPEFVGRLADNTLVLSPKEHFATEGEVRAVSDRFVAGWQVSAGLEFGRPDFRLRHTSTSIVDRSPTPGTGEVHLAEKLHLSGSAFAKLTYRTYPSPPQGFALTPEVEVLWDRYCRYVAGQEPLLSMAYFCYTLLARGDQRGAAKTFDIEDKVLRKLSELTSTRGDNLSARKMTATTAPLTRTERVWIEAAIKSIIKHLATRSQGTRLQMTSLPPI